MRAAALPTLLLLAACGAQGGNEILYLKKKNAYASTPNTVRHCYNSGCSTVKTVPLTNAEFQWIFNHFLPIPEDAEQERESIKKAVQSFEIITGKKTGTNRDKGGTFKSAAAFQQDCVDESTNTTAYLTLLKRKGLLRFHDVRAPTMRLPLLHGGGWPHQTAVIMEKGSGEAYAVDSWFHDNGSPPEIVPLTLWKEGWKPDNG